MRSSTILSALLLACLGGVLADNRPNIFMLLIDDYGWADAGWHNKVTTKGKMEVQTPRFNELIKEGIELNNHYTYKYCSPTRSALQSGRNPIHVNVQNLPPTYTNPADPVAGFSAIARNMTGMAMVLKKAGYATAAVGKWDAGMATPDHTPRGRGYDQSLIYFHHANDYWTYQTGQCKKGVSSDASGQQSGKCPAKFTIKENTGMCLGGGQHQQVANQEECCSLCATDAGCKGWTFHHDSNACFFCNKTQHGKSVNRTSGCIGNACNSGPTGITDLWSDMAPAHQHKPAAKCHEQSAQEPWPAPKGTDDCLYEDALFESEVARIIKGHNATARPLFLFWAPHIVHGPAQLPQQAYDAFSFISASDKSGGTSQRQKYLARVNYIDAAIGRIVDLLKAKDMWANSLLVLSSDNGGPLGSANNWPLKGGKSSNFQGGVRVNAFVSGGALPTSVRGTRLDEIVAIWDWYATFAAIAGADPTDTRAAAAGLPPIDSINQWPLLAGLNSTSARTELPLGSCDAADAMQDVWCQTNGHQRATVPAVIAWIDSDGERHLWKLLVGKVSLGGWEGPKAPNGTARHMPIVDCGMPPHAGEGCLYDLTVDPTERDDLSGNPVHRSKRDLLLKKLVSHNSTTHSPDRGVNDPNACASATGRYGDFWGPWIGIEDDNSLQSLVV